MGKGKERNMSGEREEWYVIETSVFKPYLRPLRKVVMQRKFWRGTWFVSYSKRTLNY